MERIEQLMIFGAWLDAYDQAVARQQAIPPPPQFHAYHIQQDPDLLRYQTMAEKLYGTWGRMAGPVEATTTHSGRSIMNPSSPSHESAKAVPAMEIEESEEILEELVTIDINVEEDIPQTLGQQVIVTGMARPMSMAEKLAAEGIYVRGYYPQQHQCQEIPSAETLPPLEPTKAIVMEPPLPSHERAEATKAMEEELSEAIPVPILSPPSKDTSGRSEENQWPTEQCHVQVLTPHTSYMEQDNQVNASSMIIEQVVREIELLSGVEKAQELGRRQERKAAMRKTPGERKSGPSGRYKARHVKMKGSRATSRMIKPSIPRNTTRVKMKASSGVEELKEIDSGQCVPKMVYFKHIDREDLFPPPFIP